VSVIGWTVSGFRFMRRPSDPGPYVALNADLVDDGAEVIRRVQLVASPSGRNVHVHVDGVRYEEAKP
jgi:hypothetical protein